MRSKECLETEKPSYYYYDLVKKAIYDLYPLRANKRKTFKYINRCLFADIREREFTRNHIGDISKTKFELREGEVDNNDAYQVRNEIINAIMHDESFIYAYNIIVLGENSYSDNIRLKGYEPKTLDKNTHSNIREVICNYREDYPKTRLCEYLTDEDNKAYYDNCSYKLKRKNSWWLEAFNLAYEVFDRLRVNSHTASEALEIIEEINTGDELLDTTSREIICYMSEKYCYDVTDEQRIMLGLLSDLLKNSYRVPEKEADVVADAGEVNNSIVLTCSQQTKIIVFMLSHMGVNYKNTDKIKIARLIHGLTGRNLQNIRTRMDINYDSDHEIKDLKIIADFLNETLPFLSEKIKKDIKPDI